ncbi:MAG: DsbE family thiol:disulfide interchange protein [Paracoccaceae bacterium]|nr:DsbE family thiol:disulfide interchange protein [Paracoccaceae bacterium]
MAKLSPLMIAPPLVFAGIAGLFAVGLTQDNDDSITSALVGQLAPEIVATPLGELPVFDSAALVDGEVKIVNIWASWCPPCRAEHPALMDLAADGVPVYGINKSDNDANAQAFLAELGDPFAAIVTDTNGRQSLDWGVVALPETFIIDGDGVVTFRFAGPIHRVMESTILPELALAAE